MYRFLGKRFYLKPDWTFDLKEFAYEHIGLGRNYEGGTQIARKLQPAIDELEAVGFLEPLTENDRFLKEGPGLVDPLHPEVHSPLPCPLAGGIDADPPRLVTELITRGVTAKTAAELVEQYPAEVIQLKMDVFDWLMEKQDKRIAQKPGRLSGEIHHRRLRRSQGFVSKAERQRQQERPPGKGPAGRGPPQSSRKPLASVPRPRVAAYRKALTPDELARHEADAIAQASQENRSGISDDPAMASSARRFCTG